MRILKQIKDLRARARRPRETKTMLGVKSIRVDFVEGQAAVYPALFEGDERSPRYRAHQKPILLDKDDPEFLSLLSTQATEGETLEALLQRAAMSYLEASRFYEVAE